MVCWQRGYLEKSLDALKRKSAKDASVFASDRSKLLRENSIVTTEINALRYVACLLGGPLACLESTHCRQQYVGAYCSGECITSCNACQRITVVCGQRPLFACVYSLVDAGVRSGGCSRTLCATSWG